MDSKAMALVASTSTVSVVALCGSPVMVNHMGSEAHVAVPVHMHANTVVLKRERRFIEAWV
jgi:hypothetical protein